MTAQAWSLLFSVVALLLVAASTLLYRQADRRSSVVEARLLRLWALVVVAVALTFGVAAAACAWSTL